MLKHVKWSEDRSYKSGGEDEPIQFYLDGLCNSINLDLLLGYFSSSAINVLSLGFATFLYNGGKLRLIINNVLSQFDKDAIKSGQEHNIGKTLIDLSDINQLKNTLDEYGKHFFECLAWLISNKKIEIKIIKPKEGKGIAHFKNGIFYDKSDYVGFSASCNFTAYGLIENLERLEAFLGWENNRSTKFTNGIKLDFENIFFEKDENVEYLGIDEIVIAIKNEFGGKTSDELIIKEKELIESKRDLLNRKKLKQSFEKILINIEELESKIKFPYLNGPREYQKEAYSNWVENNYQGVFAMATGTGKTITSLNCLLQETLKNANTPYHAIILVPTITLVNQWKDEANKFNFREIIKVSSQNAWESELATTLSTAKRIPTSFIIITTYASFIKDRFQNYLKDFPIDTIFIADEAHNLGSKSVLNRLENLPFQKRIGLSATPKRIYDLEGSMAMETFFNDKEPYTYSFSMERAIKEGILCKYYYYPHLVALTNDELTEYVEITEKLIKFLNKKSENFDPSPIVEMLLLKRKRIIHKAFNKLEATKQIMKSRFLKEGNLKYSFIYVPEGITSEIIGEENDDVEDIKIINQYTREIGKIDDSLTVNQFVSGMKDRDEILEQFKEGKIQLIASMKCLDEGVDIPRAEFAVFCSSTGNPRQFIQRRGRILRTHANKDIAVIHDLIVIPDLSSSHVGSDTFRVEKKLVEKELERVMYFASLAINPYETEEIFKEICNHYDLNIYTIHHKLKQL